jgi:hypothetical protein
MKGFLNKNQKVAGKAGGSEGKPVAAADGKPAVGAPLEQTPKADILLPKKHDRR